MRLVARHLAVVHQRMKALLGVHVRTLRRRPAAGVDGHALRTAGEILPRYGQHDGVLTWFAGNHENA